MILTKLIHGLTLVALGFLAAVGLDSQALTGNNELRHLAQAAQSKLERTLAAPSSSWTGPECDRALIILNSAHNTHAAYRDQLRQGPQAIDKYIRQASGQPYDYKFALKWEEEWTDNYDFLIGLAKRVCIP